MNGNASGLALLDLFDNAAAAVASSTEVVVFPPFTLVAAAAARCRTLAIGGQDCHDAPAGAFTGSVSAGMLKDTGAAHVILGHSERRQAMGETDALVRAKAVAALSAGLHPIICVGETSDERDRGIATDVVRAQLLGSVPDCADPAQLSVAYEPLWAIGSGRTPLADDIATMLGVISEALAGIVPGARVLYGGSVSANNAASILALSGCDGVLVGGASLDVAAFGRIVAAAAPTVASLHN